MRILFIVASLFEDAVDIADAPLGIGYIISYAKSKGINFDYKVVSSPRFEDEIQDYRPDLVAVSAFTVTYDIAKDIAVKCKKEQLPCIVGGIHISLLPESLSQDFSLGVVGEGEVTFTEILQKFVPGKGWDNDTLSQIHGIAFYDNGKFVLNPRRQLVENLDDLPFPVDLSALQTTNRMTAVSSRGCPYRCVFCASSRLWKKVRYNSPEYMVEHIEKYIQSHPNIHQVKLWDDLFSVNKVRLKKFTQLCKESKILSKIKFFILCRVDSIDDETIELFKKMNVSDIHLGIESGSQKTLSYIGKRYTVQQAALALEKLSKENFLTEASYVVGFPGETYDDAMETLRFIKKYQKGLFRVFPLTPLPATPIWDIAKNMGVVTEDETMEWSRLGMVVRGNSRDLFMNGKFPLIVDAMSREELHRVFLKIEHFRLFLRYKTFIKYLFKQPWRLIDFAYYRIRFIVRSISI